MDYTFRNEKRTIGFCLFLIGLSLWLPEGVFKTGLCSYLKDWCFHNTEVQTRLIHSLEKS